MLEFFAIIGFFSAFYFTIKFGENNWRHTEPCPHCGKFYDQPKNDHTDWRKINY